MIYDVNWVETTEECDLLTSNADDEISELQLEIVELQQKQKLLAKVTSDVKSEYQSNQDDLVALNTKIPTQPEGKSKRDNIKEQKRLEYRQVVLEDRKESYNNVARMENQRQIGRREAEITKLNVYRSAIVARKVVLAAA